MSTEENKALVRRFDEEVWGKGNLAVADELLATNFVLHAPPPEVAPDLEGYKQWVSTARTAFPDLQTTIEDMIAEGDKVVTRWTVRGTHKGEIMGIAPTGKQVTMTGISIDRIEGGKIVEEWNEMDMLGMMQQLGAVPPPKQAGG
jgi:steroid delta-isomerase-like uncharacterized protein